jgi:hypothetical protein
LDISIEKSAGCLLKTKWLMKNCISEANKFTRQIIMISFFISHFVFRRQPAEFFFSKKIRQMKAGLNNRYDITKTLDVVQVRNPHPPTKWLHSIWMVPKLLIVHEYQDL